MVYAFILAAALLMLLLFGRLAGVIIGALLVIYIVAWAFGWLFATSSRGVQRRFKTGLCMNCGYDLRETPGRCPECGKFM